MEYGWLGDLLLTLCARFIGSRLTSSPHPPRRAGGGRTGGHGHGQGSCRDAQSAVRGRRGRWTGAFPLLTVGPRTCSSPHLSCSLSAMTRACATPTCSSRPLRGCTRSSHSSLRPTSTSASSPCNSSGSYSRTVRPRCRATYYPRLVESGGLLRRWMTRGRLFAMVSSL